MRNAVLCLFAFAVSALGAAAAGQSSAADKALIFKAAGFKAKGNKYVRCEDDGAASSEPGSIELEDLNGDGVAEAWVRESSTYCYGNTAMAFVLVTKNKVRGWTPILDEVGEPSALKTKSKGWFDIEVGGPGMGPFPVFRYNGKK